MKKVGLLVLLAVLFMATMPAMAMDIHKAAHDGNLSVVKALLAKNHKLINRVDKYGNTPLYVAVANRQKSVVVYLLAEGAQVNMRNCNGRTALHRAAWNGDADLSVQILARKAKWQIRDRFGKTAFYYAKARHFDNVVKVFREYNVKY